MYCIANWNIPTSLERKLEIFPIPICEREIELSFRLWNFFFKFANCYGLKVVIRKEKYLSIDQR